MKRPTERGIRGPNDGQRNGDFLNPPRYPQQGGMTSPGSLKGKTEMNIVPPNTGRGDKLPPLPKGNQ
ncbi:MAG: hypothetical protein ACRD52_00695 [Candidatus Acidiferrales bacterium]